MCVRHLVAFGHTKVAIINGSSWLQTARDRYKRYEMAFKGSQYQDRPVTYINYRELSDIKA
jgi:DNA-binding LacI/PurR family transcriptional regulator